MPLLENPHQLISDLYDKKAALGAFNLVDVDTVLGALDAAEELDQPIIIQTSESLVKYYSAANLFSMFNNAIARYKIPVILHLDHSSNLKIIKDCLEAGWNSVMVDGSHLPLEDNIVLSNKVIDLAKQYGALVECELGPILGEEDGAATSSSYDPLTKEVISKYMTEVKPDMLALGIGNKHGFYEQGGLNKLDISLLDVARDISATPLVLHGGTGIPDDFVLETIKKGVIKVNVSTELKKVYFETYKNWVEENKLNIPQVKKEIRSNLKVVVKEYLRKFYRV